MIPKQHKINQNKNIITQNSKTYNTKSQNTDIYETKRHFHFIHNLSHCSNESPQKSSPTFPSQNTQKRLSQNASTFEFKRTCVFLQT